jgi:transcriptional regulator of met regulon
MKMVKFTMSLPEAMKEALEKERTHRKLDTLQETIRSVLAEYFREQSQS